MPCQFPSSNEVPSDTGPIPQARDVRCRTAPGGRVAASAHPSPAGEVTMHAESQAVRVASIVVEGSQTRSIACEVPDVPVETPRRVPVKGFARLAAYLRGKEILILGPGNAGKSKFAQYLRFAALDPEGEREMTYALTKSPTFVLGVGGEEGFELKVRRTVDTCGQVGPLQHALLVARRQPHAVIVILDCGADPRSMLRWLCLFCDALDSILRKAPSVARRLQEMVVILNKRDKIDDRELAKLHQGVRKALERFLTVAWGKERVRSIPILECISVQTERGTALIDGAIAQLAERLAGRQGRPGAAVGPRPVAVSPARPQPGPSRPSCRPAVTLSSPPAGQQDQPGAAVAPRPVAAWPARFRLFPPHPSCRSIPAPSSPATPTPAP